MKNLDKSKIFFYSNIYNHFNLLPNYIDLKNHEKELFYLDRESPNGFFKNPNKSKYKKLFEFNINKRNAAEFLIKNFNFNEINYFGEIGGLPFFQAKVIKDKYSHLKTILTDNDEINLHILKEANIFKKSNLKCFDFRKDNLDLFIDCDLLILWGVDYLMNDIEISKLLSFSKKNSIKLIFATINVNSSFLYYLKLFCATYLKYIHNHSRYKLIGYTRTQRYFLRLIDIHNLHIQKVISFGNYRFFIINPLRKLN